MLRISQNASRQEEGAELAPNPQITEHSLEQTISAIIREVEAGQMNATDAFEQIHAILHEDQKYLLQLLWAWGKNRTKGFASTQTLLKSSEGKNKDFLELLSLPSSPHRLDSSELGEFLQEQEVSVDDMIVYLMGLFKRLGNTNNQAALDILSKLPPELLSIFSVAAKRRATFGKNETVWKNAVNACELTPGERELFKLWQRLADCYFDSCNSFPKELYVHSLTTKGRFEDDCASLPHLLRQGIEQTRFWYNEGSVVYVAPPSDREVPPQLRYVLLALIAYTNKGSSCLCFYDAGDKVSTGLLFGVAPDFEWKLESCPLIIQWLQRLLKGSLSEMDPDVINTQLAKIAEDPIFGPLLTQLDYHYVVLVPNKAITDAEYYLYFCTTQEVEASMMQQLWAMLMIMSVETGDEILSAFASECGISIDHLERCLDHGQDFHLHVPEAYWQSLLPVLIFLQQKRWYQNPLVSEQLFNKFKDSLALWYFEVFDSRFCTQYNVQGLVTYQRKLLPTYLDSINEQQMSATSFKALNWWLVYVEIAPVEAPDLRLTTVIGIFSVRWQDMVPSSRIKNDQHPSLGKVLKNLIQTTLLIKFMHAIDWTPLLVQSWAAIMQPLVYNSRANHESVGYSKALDRVLTHLNRAAQWMVEMLITAYNPMIATDCTKTRWAKRILEAIQSFMQNSRREMQMKVYHEFDIIYKRFLLIEQDHLFPKEVDHAIEHMLHLQEVQAVLNTLQPEPKERVVHKLREFVYDLMQLDLSLQPVRPSSRISAERRSMMVYVLRLVLNLPLPELTRCRFKKDGHTFDDIDMAAYRTQLLQLSKFGEPKTRSNIPLAKLYSARIMWKLFFTVPTGKSIESNIDSIEKLFASVKHALHTLASRCQLMGHALNQNGPHRSQPLTSPEGSFVPGCTVSNVNTLLLGQPGFWTIAPSVPPSGCVLPSFANVTHSQPEKLEDASIEDPSTELLEDQKREAVRNFVNGCEQICLSARNKPKHKSDLKNRIKSLRDELRTLKRLALKLQFKWHTACNFLAASKDPRLDPFQQRYENTILLADANVNSMSIQLKEWAAELENEKKVDAEVDAELDNAFANMDSQSMNSEPMQVDSEPMEVDEVLNEGDVHIQSGN